MPITVNTTDTFEQWRVKTNDIASGLETNVNSVYSSLSSNVNTLNASIASGTANVFAGLTSNVNTLNSSIASNTAASFAGLTSNVSTLNSSISSNTAAVFAGLTSNVSTLNSSIAANVALIHTNITSNVNTLNTNKLNLSGGTMTGAITTVNGGVGINIGDDARLADRNETNTMYVEGIQNNDRGYINFSTTTNNALGAVNGGALTWRGATVLHSSNYNSYAPTLSGTGASGTWGINVTGSAYSSTYATYPASGGNFITTSNFRSASGYDYLQYVSMPSYVFYWVWGDNYSTIGALPATGTWLTNAGGGIYSLLPSDDSVNSIGGLEGSNLVRYTLRHSAFQTPPYTGYYVARKNNGVWIDDEVIGSFSYFTLTKGEWITQIGILPMPTGTGVVGGVSDVF